MLLLSDLISLLVALLYVAALIALSQVLRLYFHAPLDITRKIVHVGVGMTALVITTFFRDWSVAIIGPLAFTAINYLSYRRKIFQGIELDEQGQLGTVYFPLSFAILTPLLWSRPELLAAAFMPMTWGDATAAILGKRFGAHQFSVFGQVSSVEGSIAMMVFGFTATALAFVAFGQPPAPSMVTAFVVAVVAMAVEALSPNGIDNLSVPIISAVILLILNGYGK